MVTVNYINEVPKLKSAVSWQLCFPDETYTKRSRGLEKAILA